jgi:hypothetical protein
MHPCLAAFAALALAGPTAARPVSWPGGTTLLQEFNADEASLHLHYTPSRHWSVGPRALRTRAEDRTLAGIQATWLVRRWNMPGAQANLYLSGLAGADWIDGGETRPGGAVQVQGDWENRRLMVMGMARLNAAGGRGTDDMQLLRAGFAPHAGDYGDVHFWLFGQVRRMPSAANRVEPAFVARLFYRTALVEAGVTGRGGLVLNSQFRF